MADHWEPPKRQWRCWRQGLLSPFRPLRTPTARCPVVPQQGQFLLDNPFSSDSGIRSTLHVNREFCCIERRHHASIHRAASCGHRRVSEEEPVEGGEPASRKCRFLPEVLEGRCLLATFTSYPVPSTAFPPSSITVGPDGNLWFIDQGAGVGGGQVGTVTPAGKVTIFPGGVAGQTRLPPVRMGAFG